MSGSKFQIYEEILNSRMNLNLKFMSKIFKRESEFKLHIYEDILRLKNGPKLQFSEKHPQT